MTTPRLTAYFDARYVTGRFGDPRPNGRIHEGTDFSHSRTPGLTPVPALLAGQVVNIWAPSSGHGYGHRVDIRTVEGVVSYAHLHARSPFWMGQRVAQGDTVGFEGTSGFVSGPCCHVEHAVNGRKRDPLPLIRNIIAAPAGGGAEVPAGVTKEWDEMASKAEVKQALLEALASRPDTVLIHYTKGTRNGIVLAAPGFWHKFTGEQWTQFNAHGLRSGIKDIIPVNDRDYDVFKEIYTGGQVGGTVSGGVGISDADIDKIAKRVADVQHARLKE